MSATVTPSKRSWTRTRRVDSSRCTAGTRTVERSPSSERHLAHRVGLVTEVDLFAQTLRELGEQLTGADALAERSAPLGDVGEQCESREVALHHRLDVGPLHLDTTASPECSQAR